MSEKIYRNNPWCIKKIDNLKRNNYDKVENN